MRQVFLLIVVLLCSPPLTVSAESRRRKRKRKGSSAAAHQLISGGSVVLPNVGAGELTVLLPSTSSAITIRSSSELMPHVVHAYKAIVEPHQAGLTDARETALQAVPLSEAEAWHHYQAGLSGVVDSARLMVAFSIVPALQSATSRLHALAARGDADGLRALLDDTTPGGGVRDVDEPAPTCGSTALLFASATGSKSCVRLLLNAGASAEATGRAGVTPLMVASAMGHTDVVAELLLAPAEHTTGSGGPRGADPNATHSFGHSTALHFAAEMGRADVIYALCAAGAHADAPKTQGGTPLHVASDSDRPTAIRALLAPPCNASTSALVAGDTSPLYLAAQRGHTRAVAALVGGGADVNFVMPRGRPGSQLPLLARGRGGAY